MSSKADFFLSKTLGEDFFESLEKFELWKQDTKTVIDHEEIKTALMIVPRTLMSFLIYHLSSMNIGETKEIQLPVQEAGAILRVTKHERDVLSGEIESSTEKYTNKKVAEFKYRSIPGVGLVVMSTFELYDTSKLLDPPQNPETQAPKMSQLEYADVQKMIDERLMLHDLIGRVVEKKMAEKDAINQLMMAKLTEELKKEKYKNEQVAKMREVHEDATPQDDAYFRGMTNGIEVANSIVNEKDPEFVESPKKKKKSLLLKEFLGKREEKLKKKEYSAQMMKGETIHCPDCENKIFDSGIYSGCVCFGENQDSKIYIKKSEDGVKIRFGNGWDPENIELLLEVLRGKRG